MSQKLYILTITAVFSLLIASCGNSKDLLDETNPTQKRADITIENKDYYITNKQLYEITDNYKGIIKKASLHYNEYKQGTAEYEILVPFTFFYDFLKDLHNKFTTDIKAENISDEEARTRLYYTCLKQIEQKKQNRKTLTKILERSDNAADQKVAQIEIDNVDNDILQLEQEKQALTQAMNYSTVTINWTDCKSKFFNDTIYVPVEKAITGFEQPRSIVFSEFGQEETFGIAEPVKIFFSGVDTSKAEIISKIDFENNTIGMKLVKYGVKETVRLDKKCQIINVGTGPLPEIICGEGIGKEQVIITPRVDDNCNIIGYEIRAGTIEAGCTQGRQNLARLKNCNSYGKPVKKHTTTQPRRREVQRRVNEDLELFYSLPID